METVVKVVIVPEEEWKKVIDGQEEIVRFIKGLWLSEKQDAIKQDTSPYLTAIEFMTAVRIKRTKFDQLVATSQIKVIRKGRKIYVPSTEIQRYFSTR